MPTNYARPAEGPILLPPVHPAALMLPEMDADQFAALRDDIAQHGLREPVVLLEDAILDGRHRYRACAELGLRPSVVQWSDAMDGDPVTYVLSRNLFRRHLTDDQRAAVALASLPLYEAQAKARQAEAARETNQRLRRLKTTLTPVRGELSPTTTARHAAESTAKAGKAAGVSRAKVERAKKIAEAPGGETRIAAIAAGEKTIAETERELRAEAAERDATTTAGALAATGRAATVERLKLLQAYDKRLAATLELSAFVPGPLADALDSRDDAGAKWAELAHVAAGFALWAERVAEARHTGLRMVEDRRAQEEPQAERV